MTFTQLEIFAVLAKLGSFSRAAAALGITQSGVSHALKQLETELGVMLLKRDVGNITLTDSGERLLPRANDILQQKEALQQEAGLERGITRGTLRIASFGATSSLRLLPPLLARFRQAHPMVEVHIDEVVDDKVVYCLLERRAEIGFVVLPEDRFDTVPLVTDELVAVLPAAHPLAKQEAIRAQDFEGLPFIRTSAGSGSHIDRFFASAGVVPTTFYRFEQLSSMLGFVATADAVTIAARLALPEPPQGVVYRRLSPPRPREIGLAALQRDKLSPAARAFMDLATRYKAELPSSALS
ncbi:LysR family transcriptional regulator [Curvibacter sp. CHRR-16]|uniref:LysR family transcriptional regulator n=1 Tax=Curvibacter sp. CHRR-16 TaxID=2835872 RepID=UPI001BD955C6|nr:LysR family transcriptional regulator [Curvibacter sp. CHRR-16]MBT0571552.1 LysR family transcriptional regulator [Curvibacter sp. CHRR-16]